MSQALKKAMDAIDINLSKTTKTKEKYWEKNIEDDFEDFLRENDVYDESLTIDILREVYFKVENKKFNQDFMKIIGIKSINAFLRIHLLKGKLRTKA